MACFLLIDEAKLFEEDVHSLKFQFPISDHACPLEVVPTKTIEASAVFCQPGNNVVLRELAVQFFTNAF